MPSMTQSRNADREGDDALQQAPTEGVNEHSLRLIATCLAQGKRCDQLHEDPVKGNQREHQGQI